MHVWHLDQLVHGIDGPEVRFLGAEEEEAKLDGNFHSKAWASGGVGAHGQSATFQRMPRRGGGLPLNEMPWAFLDEPYAFSGLAVLHGLYPPRSSGSSTRR